MEIHIWLRRQVALLSKSRKRWTCCQGQISPRLTPSSHTLHILVNSSSQIIYNLPVAITRLPGCSRSAKQKRNKKSPVHNRKVQHSLSLTQSRSTKVVIIMMLRTLHLRLKLSRHHASRRRQERHSPASMNWQPQANWHLRKKSHHLTKSSWGCPQRHVRF